MSKKKPLIVFEGIEGTGKTTLINHVSTYLRKKNISFVKIREPGGNRNSELIRKLILNKKNKFNSFTDLMLYFAARSENIEKIINKYYTKKIILIDRFTDSTLAYQHYGMKLDKLLINKINRILLKKINSQITFLNIVSEKNLKKRLNIRKNKNRYDNFKIKFYKKVQNGFLKISKNKKNYILINSNNNLAENKKKVLNQILKFIN
jgi:dTMP kinase|tara:strand:+ start:3219 stop:3836 length:618 start_codon:yes stop_codon:yes gene_type:complete